MSLCEHLGEVYSLTLGLGSGVALSQLGHHLHQVTSLGCPLRLNLNLPSPPPPLSGNRQAQSVFLQHQIISYTCVSYDSISRRSLSHYCYNAPDCDQMVVFCNHFFNHSASNFYNYSRVQPANFLIFFKFTLKNEVGESSPM